jgi:shikimate kinase
MAMTILQAIDDATGTTFPLALSTEEIVSVQQERSDDNEPLCTIKTEKGDSYLVQAPCKV